MTSESTSSRTRQSVDAVRWPDVAAVHGTATRTVAARLLFTAAVAKLPIWVRWPDGRLSGDGHPGAPVMIVHRSRDFFRRLGDSGDRKSTRLNSSHPVSSRMPSSA